MHLFLPVQEMHASTVEATIVATIAVPLNVISLVVMAQMWQRRHDMMVSTNRIKIVIKVACLLVCT